jgi:threonylcarbamoyladenosine tRNA methylthiotransferase MtaB
VTADADRKSRFMARSASRRNPAAAVVVTGCFAQRALDSGEVVEGATLLVPNALKMDTARLLMDRFPHLLESRAIRPSPGRTLAVFPLASHDYAPTGAVGRTERTAAHSRTRATLKIQDGCRHYCAFCSIPYTRPAMASRPFAEIVAEARHLADEGATEIVVTGVCVGAYGLETGGAGLADVLRAVAAVPGIMRVRLSSVQPVEVTEPVIRAVRDTPGIAPHLHLSLQSGDDTVLRLMGRPYTTAFYEYLVGRLREAAPEIGITTDIIVGFPGETRDLFENSLAFARRMQFAKIHAFRYSARPQTAAARLRDDVSHEEKERRHAELSAAGTAGQRAFAQMQVGRVADVLVEGRGRQDDWLSGYTGNYVRVHFPAPRSLRGSMVPVTLTSVLPEGECIGRFCAQEKENG